MVQATYIEENDWNDSQTPIYTPPTAGGKGTFSLLGDLSMYIVFTHIVFREYIMVPIVRTSSTMYFIQKLFQNTGKQSNLVLIYTGIKFLMLEPAITGATFTRGHFDIRLSIEIPGSFLANGGPIFTSY